MVKHTFKEWGRVGYYVLKGSKSGERNADGVPLFTEEQVISGDDLSTVVPDAVSSFRYLGSLSDRDVACSNDDFDRLDNWSSDESEAYSDLRPY